MNIQTRDFAFELKAISETGMFSGYGSVFGIVDSYKEIVAPGAFKESLAKHREKGTLPAMLWQHRSAEPMGVYTSMAEDEIGLKVEGQIAMKTQVGAEAYELLKMKAISGLSIGFVPREESVDHDTNITTLLAVDLWETSLVTFPANDSARVEAIKTIEQIEDLKSAEKFLRDSGLSRREALIYISRLKTILQSDSANEEMQDIFEAIKSRPIPN